MERLLDIDGLSTKLIDNGAFSVFLYGSRARGDNLPDSDWEVGAVFDDKKYIPRSELVKFQPEDVVIYPFRYSDLKTGTAETPFTQSIWLTEIILAAKTIGGEDIISQIPRPSITLLDILAESNFSKARALDAMIAQRKGHNHLARDLFVKSALIGSRALLLAEDNPFPKSYPEIVESAKQLLDDDMQQVLSRSLELRMNKGEVTTADVFDNIGLQMIIENRIMANAVKLFLP